MNLVIVLKTIEHIQLMESTPFHFCLNPRQIEQFKAWREQFDECGPIGGSFSFIFIPTSLFTAVYVKHDSGAKLDLTPEF
jgi:hypothetical protein